MANNNRKYKGSLRLDWINKDLSLYYEIDEKEGKGVRPVWVPKNDIRVAEPRILKFVKSYGDPTSENLLIKGDNLLVLRSLVEMFKGKPEKNRVKCVYIDPPFNTGNAFKYYDDNLQHSEWLTMMRDRLQLLRKLMRKDGVIFVHIDDEEMAYLKVLMDEIFGRDNFLAQIVWERSPGAGIGQGGKFVINVAEFILVYARDFSQFREKKPSFKELLSIRTMKQYNKILISEGRKKLIKEIKAKSNGESVKLYKHESYKIETISGIKEENYLELLNVYKKNFARIFGTNRPQKENTFQWKIINLMPDNGFYSLEYIPSRGKYKGQKTTIHYFNKRILGYLSSVAELDKEGVKKIEKMTDFWDKYELSSAGISFEGGVKLQRGKKPEGLIKRILNMCTKQNDLVLDIFAGSGTTGAVAHKMGRRWIMVEIGRQAEKLIIPRMQRVISGKDQTGISKEVNWKGGGGFKYYKLGESVIYEKDMNWKLKAKEMAEAIFLHFQYKPVKVEWLEKYNMYLGKHRSARYHFALSYATRKTTVIDEEMYETIIKRLEKEKNFRHLTIFTNVAVAIPPESMDERVLVKKIPAAILREYNLL